MKSLVCVLWVLSLVALSVRGEMKLVKSVDIPDPLSLFDGVVFNWDSQFYVLLGLEGGIVTERAQIWRFTPDGNQTGKLEIPFSCPSEPDDCHIFYRSYTFTQPGRVTILFSAQEAQVFLMYEIDLSTFTVLPGRPFLGQAPSEKLQPNSLIRVDDQTAIVASIADYCELQSFDTRSGLNFSQAISSSLPTVALLKAGVFYPRDAVQIDLSDAYLLGFGFSLSNTNGLSIFRISWVDPHKNPTNEPFTPPFSAYYALLTPDNRVLFLVGQDLGLMLATYQINGQFPPANAIVAPLQNTSGVDQAFADDTNLFVVGADWDDEETVFQFSIANDAKPTLVGTIGLSDQALATNDLLSGQLMTSHQAFVLPVGDQIQFFTYN